MEASAKRPREDEEEVPSSGVVPITGVTLYDNGYAVFERETMVQGNGQIDLYFPKNLIKNVLESLQFAGEAGANVGNIAYEATKPKANIEFSERSPFVNLLKSLVGCNVCLEMKESEQETGRIIGMEYSIPNTVSADMDSIPHVSLYKSGGRLKVIPINTISEVKLLEERTQQDVSFSLDLTKKESRDDNMQKLSVFYSNVQSQQKLIARYGFKVNEWKSSYRMTYSMDSPSSLMLHGLAIIENSLWEDWNDVRVTLVVGTPSIQVGDDSKDEGQWLLSVKSLDGSTINVRANPRDSVLRLKAKIGKKKGLTPFAFKLMYCGKAVEDGRQLSDYTIGDGSQLHMTKVDESQQLRVRQSNSQQTQFVMAAQDNLSSYPIPAKVTAQRKQKAIVTMLNAELEGQHVIFYDETIRKGNPLCALLFENTTGRTLDGGSLILSTQDSFIGQSNLPTLSPGDESPPIPFAVELGCEVVKSSDSTYLKPNRVEVIDGSIHYYRIHRVVTIYRIQNKNDKKLDFILNHLFLEDYDLVQKPNVEEEEPVDITDRFYQFRFEVSAKCEKKSFLVREEITDCKKHSIKTLDADEFDRFVGKKHFDADTETAIRKTFAMRKEISSLEKTVYEIEGDIREINQNQSHIRENISALEHHVKQASKYISSLEVEEDKLKAAQEQLKKCKNKKAQLQKTLTTSINEIKFNRVLVVPTQEPGEEDRK